MTGTPPTLAVFDFDGTLIEGDSFLHFLIFTAGLTRFLAALAEALIVAGLARAWPTAGAPDTQTLIKERLVLRLLAGRKATKLQRPIARLRQSLIWRESMRRALFDHHSQGHHIVIASGALDLYLQDLLNGLPHHGLLCTHAEIVDGRVTGRMPLGNCVRQRKAELLREYIEQHGPFGTSFGYGNAPHDLPMLELLKHRIVV